MGSCETGQIVLDGGSKIYKNVDTGRTVRSFVNRRGAGESRRQIGHRAGQQLVGGPRAAARALEILIELLNGVPTGHAGATVGVLPAGFFARRGGNFPRGPVSRGWRC